MTIEIVTSVNQRTLELAAPFKPNLKDFSNGKSFSELYENEESFVQIIFTDKHNPNIVFHYKFNMDRIHLYIFAETVKEYKDILILAQKKAIKEHSLSKTEKRTFLHFWEVGRDIGYCNIKTFERSKVEEGGNLIYVES